MSHRPDHIASLVRRAVQAALARGLHDPRIKGMISVTKVEVEPDCTRATVHVSVMPAADGALTVAGLQHAAGRIRSGLGRSASLRHVPRLSFRLDESIKRQASVEEALAEDEGSGSPAATEDPAT